MTKTKFEAMDILNKYDIPCGPILSMKEIAEEQSLRATGTVVEVDHPTRGKYLIGRQPDQDVGQHVSEVKRSPLLGEHTEEILRDVLRLRRRADPGHSGVRRARRGHAENGRRVRVLRRDVPEDTMLDTTQTAREPSARSSIPSARTAGTASPRRRASWFATPTEFHCRKRLSRPRLRGGADRQRNRLSRRDEDSLARHPA